MSTDMKIFSVGMPPELEEKLYELRGTKEFRRCSMAEIVRKLLEAAIETREQRTTLRKESVHEK